MTTPCAPPHIPWCSDRSHLADGYIRMVRGKNMCGLAQQPSYPTGAKAAKKTAAPVEEEHLLMG